MPDILPDREEKRGGGPCRILNLRPMDYESTALTAELRARNAILASFNDLMCCPEDRNRLQFRIFPDIEGFRAGGHCGLDIG